MLETECQAARLLCVVANSLRFHIVPELGSKPSSPAKLAKELKLRPADAVRSKVRGRKHRLCKEALQCVHGIR